MPKHTILFLAANPGGIDRLALDREARAIQVELERSGHRDCFQFETRWAVEPLDLLRELRRLKPTVVHFSGHGQGAGGELALPGGEPAGLFLQAPDGRAQLVSARAIEQTFGAAGASVKLVVLNACYTEAQAEALLAHVDCVVGMRGAIHDGAARSFAIGFYGGLGEGEPVAAAYAQGRAAISLEGLPDAELPRLKLRGGVDAGRLVLAAAPSLASPPSSEQAGLIDFTAERQRHEPFVGRADVLASLDEWLLGPGETGWVAVTGGPGMGKSAILSAWLARRQAAGAVVPHHFIRRQVADWDQPEAIAVSLATQLEAAYPELRDPEAKPERRLLEVLGRVSRRLGPTDHLVVLVDGLDETRGEAGENPLPRFLPHTLPPRIRFLCATRPTYPHLSWLEAHTRLRRLDLDDRRWVASNEAVVRGFWESVAPTYRSPLPAKTLAAVAASADGNVLHAVMLHDAWRDLPAAEHQVGRIPRGLKGLVGEIWDRAASHESVRAGLGLVCAAREALSLDMLAELAGWSYDGRERFLRDARQLLLEEPSSWAGVEAYRPRHDWVRELIEERLGKAAIRAHHETLARRLATWPPPADEAQQRYAVRHALAHRIAIDDWHGVRRLASDLGYLEARVHAADASAVEQELTEAAGKCPDPAAARELADLARALARESHWIRADPRGTAGLIWNWLRRSGWSAQDLEARITLPSEGGFLRVRHAASREGAVHDRALGGHTDEVRACAVTPDGRRMISASIDRTLKVWELDSGRVVATLHGHADGVLGVAITPDGRRAVSASVDRTLKVWDLDTSCVLATLHGHADWVRAAAVTPDGRRVVSVSDDRTATVWELDTGHPLATLEGHTDWVTACAVTPDGRRVITASDDRTLRIWDLDTGHAVATLEGHTGWVHACAVTPDGRRMISASDDRTLILWDLDTARAVATLHGHSASVRGCAVTPDGRRAVSASVDRTLKVWDLDAARILTTLYGHADGLRGCAVTTDSHRAVSASDDGSLKLWSLDGGGLVATFHGQAAPMRACAVTPDGRRAIAGWGDGALEVRALDDGRLLATLGGHAAGVRACAVTPDGRRVIAACTDCTLAVWDLEAGRLLTTLRGHTNWVRACAVTPDGRRVVSGSDDRTLKVWDLEAGRVLTTLTGHTSRVRACAVTPDGRRMISASHDGTLKVWDLEAGRVLATLAGHAGPVRACAVSPDGRTVISASDDRTLKRWDLDTGRVLATFDGHTHGVRACVVTPDDRFMVSASVDRTLRVWDLATARCLYIHRADTSFRCVGVTAEVIVAGDGAGTLWILEGPRAP